MFTYIEPFYVITFHPVHENQWHSSIWFIIAAKIVINKKIKEQLTRQTSNKEVLREAKIHCWIS